MGTKLDIVNAMLRATGERPHNTLQTQHPSVLTAIDKVNEKNDEVQSRGWWFNRERHFRMVPDGNGHIAIPQNALSFSLVSPALQRSTHEGKVRYVQRGDTVYDSWNHTDVLPAGTVLYADLTTLLPIEELPLVAFNYLRAICVREFYEDDDGDLQKASKLEERQIMAWNQLRSSELKAVGTSIYDRPAVQKVLYRIGGIQQNPRYPGGGIR